MRNNLDPSGMSPLRSSVPSHQPTLTLRWLMARSFRQRRTRWLRSRTHKSGYVSAARCFRSAPLLRQRPNCCVAAKLGGGHKQSAAWRSRARARTLLTTAPPLLRMRLRPRARSGTGQRLLLHPEILNWKMPPPSKPFLLELPTAVRRRVEPPCLQ